MGICILANSEDTAERGILSRPSQFAVIKTLFKD